MSETENTPALTESQLSEIEARANAVEFVVVEGQEESGDWTTHGVFYGRGYAEHFLNGGWLDPTRITRIGDFLDVPALIAEVRRLRSLFTERDATLCWEMAEIIGRRKPSHARDKQVADYRDLEARIRSAIGETREPEPISGEGTA